MAKSESFTEGKYASNFAGISILIFSIVVMVLVHLAKRTNYEPTNNDSYSGYYFMSERMAHSQCVGKDLDYISSNFRKADTYTPLPNSEAEADFGHLALLADNGRFYGVKMHFGSDGICDAVTRHDTRLQNHDRNEWLLGHLPFVQTIMSWKILTDAAQESPYGHYVPRAMWLIRLLNACLLGILYLLWFLAPPLIPMSLFLALVPANSLKWASDKIHFIISCILSLVGSYVWFVALLTWGLHWLFALLCFFGVLFVTVMFYMDTERTGRCPNCRTVGSCTVASTSLLRYKVLNTEELEDLGFDHKEVSQKYKEKRHRQEQDSIIGYDGKTIGYETKYLEDVITKQDVYYYNKYKVFAAKYSTPVYQDTLVCKSCGHRFRTDERDGQRKLDSRQFVRTEVRLNNKITNTVDVATTITSSDSEYKR